MKRTILALLLAGTALAGLPEGGRILIITPDAFIPAIQPLADWHTRAGLFALIVPLSIAGRTPEAVRSYIRTAWQNWPVPPEYVLIGCGPDSLIGSQYCDDTWYGDMAGDYRMELPVGRLPARTGTELAVMVAKTIAYERADTGPDSLWHWKGTTCVSDDSQGGGPDPYYLPDCRHAHQLWQTAGYTHIDSLYNLAGSTNQELIEALNDGRSFITYRGVAGGTWWVPFHEFWPGSEWQNGRRMPVMVAATCATITLAPREWMLGNAALCHGTINGLGGAVAYFGVTIGDFRVSQYRSAAYRGFFDAVFTEGTDDIGRATLGARLAVDTVFHEYVRYLEWCLLGDPALRLRTAPPATISARFPVQVNTGSQTFIITCSTGVAPLPGATACLWQDTSVYATATTGPDGTASIPIHPTGPGEMLVTVTARNCRPLLAVSRVRFAGGPWLAYLKHALNDSPPAGNADGWAGPGETITLPLWLANDGDSTARAVSATIRCPDPLVTLLDSARSFGDIPAHDSAHTGPAGFRFSLPETVPDGRPLDFAIEIHSGTTTWPGAFRIFAGAPVVTLADWRIADTAANQNGILDPGETADLAAALHNTGRATGTALQLRLRTRDHRLIITDSTATIPSLPPGATIMPADGFRLSATAAIVPGTTINCTLSARAPGITADWPINVQVGTTRPGDPQTDGHYWAYEDADSAYPGRPRFCWADARRGRRLNLSLSHRNDTIELPADFGPFICYGTEYRQLTVGFQGIAIPGRRVYTNSSNVRLPRGAPPAMLAPYWDGINPDSTAAVWYWHDTTGRRVVVQWDSAYVLATRTRETWQLIIHDTTAAARDGNSVIIYQYRTAGLNTGTVGIQDHTGLIGMTVQHDTFPNRAAHRLAPGRAILFTTDEPFPAIAEPVTAARPVQFTLTAAPNPARHRVLISTSSPLPAAASLSIYDCSGRLLSARPLHASTAAAFTIDVSSLPSGLCFLRLLAGRETATAKLIIQR